MPHASKYGNNLEITSSNNLSEVRPRNGSFPLGLPTPTKWRVHVSKTVGGEGLLRW